MFGSKELTRKDFEELIRELTEDDFIIKEFASEGSDGETRVVIKFTDKERAEEFMEALEESSIPRVKGLKNVKLIFSPTESFSASLHPLLLLL